MRPTKISLTHCIKYNILFKETDRGGMNSCNNMVTYDQWSYVTMIGILELAFKTIGEIIEIDRLLLRKAARNRRFYEKIVL